jgi:hypothetical protein
MKGKFLKGFLFMACFLFLGAGSAQASTAFPEEVKFLVSDGDDTNDYVFLKVSTIGSIEYSIDKDSNVWNSFITVKTAIGPITYAKVGVDSISKTNLVYLRYNIGGGNYDCDGILTFGNGANGESTVNIQWQEGNNSIITATSKGDELEPAPAHAPIPAAVWLLGTGLIAIVGIRRKGIK